MPKSTKPLNESNRARLVRLAREAVKRYDDDGLYALLEAFAQKTQVAEQCELVEVIARHAPEWIIELMNEVATTVLEKQYAEIDAEIAAEDALLDRWVVAGSKIRAANPQLADKLVALFAEAVAS